jgi:hypothetical protein
MLRFLTRDSIGPAASHDMCTVPFTKRSEQNGDEPHSGVWQLLQTISRLQASLTLHNVSVLDEISHFWSTLETLHQQHHGPSAPPTISGTLLQYCIPHCASCTVYSRSTYNHNTHSQNTFLFISSRTMSQNFYINVADIIKTYIFTRSFFKTGPFVFWTLSILVVFFNDAVNC